MSLVLEAAIPPPHLLHTRSATRPHHPYNTHDYPQQASPPATMSPQALQSYMPRIPESPLPTQELHSLPVSSWYGPSISAPECHNETAFAPYGQYMPPHTTTTLSPTTPAYQYLANSSLSMAQPNASAAAASPVSAYSHDSAISPSARPSEEPQADLNRALQQPTPQLKSQSHLLDRPQSSSSPLHPVTHVEMSWAMNPLNMQSPHDSYYSPFPAHNPSRSPRLSESLIDLPPNHLSSPQSRRLYAPIAPQPLEAPRSHGVKRLQEEDDENQQDDVKRRKRSDSNTSTQLDLSEEDKLLLRLKEEESMPWKDIAARFQADLGKVYQIPALQMRLKRLRERMRVWTDADVRALRMAHEYWAQNKFDIISQKMLEFGAQEKWTARQCTRKWAEIDPIQPPFPHYEQHLQHGFAPYAMSPVEPPHAFLPYMHVT